jgi:hypothetical protein
VLCSILLLGAVQTNAARLDLKFQHFYNKKTMAMDEINMIPRVGCKSLGPQYFSPCAEGASFYFDGKRCIETQACVQDNLKDFVFPDRATCEGECWLDDSWDNCLHRPTVLDFFSLGHPQFLADLIYIRSLMFFVDHLFTDRIFGEQFDQYIHAIMALDPMNNSVYLWAARRVKLGQIINQEVIDNANHYARRGLRCRPNNWKYYMEIGFNLYPGFEYMPSDPVQIERNRDQALEHLRMASSLPGARIDPNLIVELHLRANQAELAMHYAYELYFDASERERESLRGRISLIEKNAPKRLRKLERLWKEHFHYVPQRMVPFLGAPIQR